MPEDVSDNTDLIGVPRQVGDDTVYDVTVSVIVASLPEATVDYPILLYQYEGRWTGIFGLNFYSLVQADTPMDALQGVLERLTMDVKEEYRKYESE